MTTLTLDCLAEVVPASLLVDDVLVDLARCDVVVTVQRDIEEALIVPKVKVDLAAIVQHKYFT